MDVDKREFYLRDEVEKRLGNMLEALAIEVGWSSEDVTAIAKVLLSEPAGTVPSNSDARTANNSTRQQYRVLTEIEKAQSDSVRELGDMMIALCHEIGGTDPDGERAGSRNLSLAITHIEDGVMRAVRHITS